MSYVLCQTSKVLNVPTSYRGIMALVKSLGGKLGRHATMHDWRNYGVGCVLTFIAVENHMQNYTDIKKVTSEEDPTLHIKLNAIEAGFENWGQFFPSSTYSQNPAVFDRYYKVGQKLSKKALPAYSWYHNEEQYKL